MSPFVHILCVYKKDFGRRDNLNLCPVTESFILCFVAKHKLQMSERPRAASQSIHTPLLLQNRHATFISLRCLFYVKIKVLTHVHLQPPKAWCGFYYRWEFLFLCFFFYTFSPVCKSDTYSAIPPPGTTWHSVCVYTCVSEQ